MKTKKLIETELPLKAINESAISEKVKKGHPGNLHLWWNRSPIYSSAALLKALIQEDPQSIDEQSTLLDEIEQIAKGQSNVYGYKDNIPVVYDPFSGFGGLVLAAQTIGLNSIAGDLNSAAVLLTKAATEIPNRFADIRPVHPGAENRMYFHTSGLAMDVLKYGKDVGENIEKEMHSDYPNVIEEKTGQHIPVFSWIWVRTMKCPNPACSCQIPMATSYVLSKSKGKEYWAEPLVDDTKVHFRIHQGICPEDKQTNKFKGVGAKFCCPACGEITRDTDVKKAGKDGKLGIQLMAVCCETENGRVFLEPDDRQMKRAKVELLDNIPIGSLPNNTRWFSPPGFGFTEYADLYTPRQLRFMSKICDKIRQIMNIVTDDAMRKGMMNDNLPLDEGGKGALAYGQAVGVYLALVAGKLANFHSSVCTWDNRKGNVRAAFTRQAIPMTWVFAEGNPFGHATGNYDSMLQSVVESIKCLPVGTEVSVSQFDAVKQVPPKHSILFTELPYYDNIGYADLSDYFYIWLRRILKDVYPKMFERVVTSKEELSSIPEHFGNDVSTANKSYRKGIDQLLENFYVASSDNFPSLIFYKVGKEDKLSLTNADTKASPLESILLSIKNAGFIITALWPVRTENANKKYDSTRVAIVFRKSWANTIGTTRRGFINTLRRKLPSLLDKAFSNKIADGDKVIVGLGFGLQVFSEFKSVMNADGTEISIHDLLQLIYQEVYDYLSAC